MAETRQLIVELRHSDGRKEQADQALWSPEDASLDTRSTPALAGLELDASFAPVEVPALVEVDQAVPDKLVSQVRALPDVVRVKALRF